MDVTEARRLALGLEYDGARFCGWQTQPSGCAVQDVLEAALACIHGSPVATVTAGRTDAGVHAVGQVVHFDCQARRPLEAWVRGVNRHLPAGVAVTWARPVPMSFDARRSALARTYRYVLLNRGVRPALLAGKVGWLHGALDLAAMRQAAQCLIGRHDFSAFRAAECQASNPVREMHRLDIDAQAGFVVFTLCANAFLQHQVRNLVGALLWVGQGRRAPAWLAQVLASRDRSQAAATFMADGLYLAGVSYPPHFELPESELHLPCLHLPT